MSLRLHIAERQSDPARAGHGDQQFMKKRKRFFAENRRCFSENDRSSHAPHRSSMGLREALQKNLVKTVAVQARQSPRFVLL